MLSNQKLNANFLLPLLLLFSQLLRCHVSVKNAAISLEVACNIIGVTLANFLGLN